MSTTVDNRVVQMRFDNKQFEQGVQTSLNSLKKLNEALLFKGAGNSKVLDIISNSLEVLTKRFSVLGTIGMNIVSKLTDMFTNGLFTAIQSVKNVVDQLTVNFQNLAASYSKYEGMVINQQTILSAVSDKINKATGL